MHSRWPPKWRYSLIAGIALAFVAAAMALWPSALETRASRVQLELAEIRGLPFKLPIAIKRISTEDSRAFIVRELAKAPKIDHYWAVVRMLGLYRGPDLEPPEVILGELSGLAGGAYDVYEDTILVFEDLDDWDQRVLFAHELYHGLQDQHFDVERYLLDMARRADANGDELLARQAVVEGDATYIDTIYQSRLANGEMPTRQQLDGIIAAQRDWTADQWEETLSDPALDEGQRARFEQAIAVRKRLPAFMFELFVRTYLDGTAFIHAVHEKGWSEVEKLYREYPPVSTEQILHPEKWFAREQPVTLAWPAFESDAIFEDWRLLHANVMGERQWQVVFAEQSLRAESKSAAAGWNGDRYAVFQRKDADALLMLLYTSWDTPVDAAEFAAAYRRLLENKYRGTSTLAHVLTLETEVLIVEGATEETADAFMAFNRRAAPNGR